MSTRRLLEQRNGGDHVDTRLHRATHIHQPPESDESRYFKLDEAHRADLDAEDELMRWTTTDTVRSLILVAASIALSHLFQGVWFAGWLK